MKERTLTILLFVAVVMALALFLVSPAIAINWGQPDTEHTNVGAIVIEIPGYEPALLCSGTLIAPNVFLTAGHCTNALAFYIYYFDLDIDDIHVTFDPDATDESEWLSVADFQTHPDYGVSRSNPYDVGALILAESPTGVEPAILPEEGFLDQLKKEGSLRQGSDGADFIVVGYGGTMDWPPPVILFEDQRQFAVSDYQALLKSWLRLSQNQATGDGGTCYGDSGGPAFWTEPGGEEILVGITSWGDAVTVATGFYYRVDTADTLNFIEQFLDD
jgi:secreted trypsin-like serine protease